MIGNSDALRLPGAGLLRGPRTLDAFWVLLTLVTNVGGVLVVDIHKGAAGSPGVFEFLLLAIGPALLWWRRRFPTLVLAGCVAVTWTYIFAASVMGPIYLPMIVALVSAITQGARVAAYAVVLGTLATWLVSWALPVDSGQTLTSGTILTAWLAFLLALGELIRYRRALTAAKRQRLLVSMEARADQVRREAAEQRLNIARDLHDVLGHQLTVINVQAKVGLQLHSSGRSGVTEALEAVREASRQALEDVQEFLDSLHEPGDGANRAPAPTLADPDTLLCSARVAGLAVTLEVSGTQRRLPAGHDLVASRVVLESLTNVLRHAGLPQTWVRLDFTPTRLTVRIDNAASNGPGPVEAPGGGRGLENMRHRLAAHGGTLTAGPADGHAWSVIAVLPLPKERS